MPRLLVVDPLRRWAAPSWRRKLSASIAAWTRSTVRAATPDSRLTTRDTVLRLTRARRATSTIVGRGPPGRVAPRRVRFIRAAPIRYRGRRSTAAWDPGSPSAALRPEAEHRPAGGR